MNNFLSTCVANCEGLKQIKTIRLLLKPSGQCRREDTLSKAVKALFHSSQNPIREIAARTFIQSQYLKALTTEFNNWVFFGCKFAASLPVGFCDEWLKRLKSMLKLTYDDDNDKWLKSLNYDNNGTMEQC